MHGIIEYSLDLTFCLKEIILSANEVLLRVNYSSKSVLTFFRKNYDFLLLCWCLCWCCCVVVVVATGSCTTGKHPWAYVTSKICVETMDFRAKPDYKRSGLQYLVEAVRRQRKRDLHSVVTVVAVAVAVAVVKL